MFIISLQFGESNSYYVRINKDNWEEIYDPQFATEFKDSLLALDWAKTNTNFLEYIKIVDSEESKQNYRKWAAEGTIRRTFNYFDKELNVPYDKNVHNNLDVLKWKIKYSQASDDDPVGSEIYRSYPDLFSIFECLFSVGTYHDNKYENRFISFTMRVKKSTTFEIFEKELNLIREYITLKREGSLIVDIMDHKVGYKGDSVNFKIKEDGSYSIADRWDDIFIGSLREVFNYWKEHRYYE